jgi:hypothetical protein
VLPPLKVLRRQETCGGVWGNHQQLSVRTRKRPTSGAGLGGNFMVVGRDESPLIAHSDKKEAPHIRLGGGINGRSVAVNS